MSAEWAVSVWLESRDEGVAFWEHQLESTGWAEIDDVRVPRMLPRLPRDVSPERLSRNS